MSLPNTELVSTAVPDTFRVYNRGRQQQRRQSQGCIIPTRNALLGAVHQALNVALLDGAAPLSPRTVHQTRKNTLTGSRFATKLSPDTFTWVSSPSQNCSQWACELTKLPYSQNCFSSAGARHDQRIWLGILSQKEEPDPVTCLATRSVQMANRQKTQIILIKTIQIPTSNW